MITVKFNDEQLQLADATTVDQLLKEKKIEAVNIAVAVNGQMVAKPDYATHKLNDGDTILVIKAFYGG